MAADRLGRPGRLRRALAVALVVAAAVLLGCAAWALWVEPRRLVESEVELRLPGWPPELNGVRVAVLTDLHVGSPFHGLPTLRRIVARTNARRPDLVVLLGDIVTQGIVGGRFVPPESIAPELGMLRAPLGRFAVLGNHDGWLDAARVARDLEAAGIVVLRDSAAAVVAHGRTFGVAGVTDLWTGRADVPRAVAAAPPGGPLLLLTHNPDIFPGVPPAVALTIAGHTHGGQVRLPLLGRPIVPSRFGQRYAAGHIAEGGRHLFVATGTGTSILPVRFRVPPEIVVLRLRSAHRRGSR